MSKKSQDLSKFFVPDLEGFRKAVISELGNTPKAIATKLKSLKIKGERNEASSCPLANYLDYRGLSAVRVAGNFELETEIGDTLEIEMPKAYHTFVEKFDNGDYPELDEDPQV